ncbi:hypothetical protein AQJ11_09525 [Streptomyces corchorusii]|uniref:Uncharacterized protein n=1 Tax=Streptomyces corchorusii TaxID=1903 RepID=A0A117QIZ7_STRCK|nr:hypothetical protein AQJ11_09525 [Streptomyces corchorusii]
MGPGSPPSAPAAAFGGPPAPAAAPPRRATALGLGVGGSMRQEVYRDDRPLGDRSEQPAGRVFVHLVTPSRWRRITGEAPPPPVDRADTRAALPWCDYHDADAEDLAPTPALEGAEPVGEWLGDGLEPWRAPSADRVTPLKVAPGKPVADGGWQGPPAVRSARLPLPGLPPATRAGQGGCHERGTDDLG